MIVINGRMLFSDTSYFLRGEAEMIIKYITSDTPILNHFLFYIY